jgi:ParB-like chromosome segregation protein Spo0J
VTDYSATCDELFSSLDDLPLAERVAALNAIRLSLAAHSPFGADPVDCVLWVPTSEVVSNDYNPNTVAPPEMELLRVSIAEDGYTQPVVTWKRDDVYEVVDGYHRRRIATECMDIRLRVHGYLPITVIQASREDRGDRIASTIRHNRARGKHGIEAMSDIVVELKRRNWSDDKIGRELGMDPDEVLRLTQITGLAEMFADREFSEAWEAESLYQDEGANAIADDNT